MPPKAAPGSLASNTQTSLRPTPGVVYWGSPAPGTAAIEASVRCWPRWAVLMKTRGPVAPGGSATTISLGSSPTSNVRTTRPALTLTMLTLSDTWLTTHAVSSSSTATATGSRPTGIEATGMGSPPALTSNTSRWPSGIFVTKSRFPLGDRAMGRTAPDSKRIESVCACAVNQNPRVASNKTDRTTARRIIRGPLLVAMDSSLLTRGRRRNPLYAGYPPYQPVSANTAGSHEIGGLSSENRKASGSRPYGIRKRASKSTSESPKAGSFPPPHFIIEEI